MPEYITGLRTSQGVKKIDYNSLGNLPELPDGIAVSDTEPTDDKVMVWIQPEVGEDDNTLVTPIAMGGTGANNAADARQALGVVGKADALTLEEIEASTDLSGKVASAEALKTFKGCFKIGRRGFTATGTIPVLGTGFLDITTDFPTNDGYWYLFTGNQTSVDVGSAYKGADGFWHIRVGNMGSSSLPVGTDVVCNYIGIKL